MPLVSNPSIPTHRFMLYVTNSWYDPDKEKAASEKLLDMGCDVMAQHCDTPYPQTLAQERGVYGIGYNSDMSKETPDSCLTSVHLELECLLYFRRQKHYQWHMGRKQLLWWYGRRTRRYNQSRIVRCRWYTGKSR